MARLPPANGSSQGGRGFEALYRWEDGLFVPAGGGWYLDSNLPRARCVVSHAHSDHLPHPPGRGRRRLVPDFDPATAPGASLDTPDPAVVHAVAYCTPTTAAVGRLRGGIAVDLRELDYRTPVALDGGGVLTLYPAGHVPGSAMVHVQTEDGSVLYTGDFKLRAGRTCEPADPPPADLLVTECTFGRPQFRFPPRAQVEALLLDLIDTAFARGRQPIVYCYALGKAQDLLHLLHENDVRATCHGAVARLADLFLGLGVLEKPVRRYDPLDFHGGPGRSPLDLRERGVLVAPPGAARSGFTTRFGQGVCRIMLSGWSLLPGSIYRYGVDHVLPISDHADYDELLETIARVSPRRVLTHHGPPEFAEDLRGRGFDARLARPPAQLSLF